jgi:hypothetical protein
LGRSFALLAAARWKAGIVGRLGRLVQPGAKLDVLSPKRRHLARQPLDRLELHQDDADQTFPVKRIKRFTIHHKLESAADSPVKRRAKRPQNHPKHGA